MTRQQLQAALARVKREGAPLDEYAAIKLALIDAPDEMEPRALPTMKPEPIRGGGVHLI